MQPKLIEEMWKASSQILLCSFWINCCFSFVRAEFLNHTTDKDLGGTVKTNFLKVCDLVPKFYLNVFSEVKSRMQQDQISFDDRYPSESSDPLLRSVQVLHTRLLFLEGAAKCFMKAAKTQPHIMTKEIAQTKRYFEQLLIERWLRDFSESTETEAFDTLTGNIFAILLPMYDSPGVQQEMSSAETLQMEQEIGFFESQIHDIRQVLVHSLNRKSQQYRSVHLYHHKNQLEAIALKFDAQGFPNTARKYSVQLLIDTTLQLLDWTVSEYTINQPYDYTRAQSVLAARFWERLLAINATLHTVSVTEGYDVYFRLVARSQTHASEFLNLNFPENRYTGEIRRLFRGIFERIHQLEMRRNTPSSYVSFDALQVNSMRQKLSAVKTYLSELESVSGSYLSVNWKLMQVKIDLRNWALEISSWLGMVGADQIQGLYELCQDNSHEVDMLRSRLESDQTIPRSHKQNDGGILVPS